MAHYPPPGYSVKPPGYGQHTAPPPVHHHTVVVQPQPVVVQQTQVRHGTTDFLGGLGRAFDTAASDFARTTREVTKDVTNIVYAPMDLLKPGYIVQIVSKINGKSLRVMEQGKVDCLGETGTACQFDVLSAGPGTSAIKLRNYAQPRFFLSITGGYLIGYGSGGPDCDFIPAAMTDSHVTFESVQCPGTHIGALPSGEITAPGQTTKQTDASHFRIMYIGMNR